MKKFFTVFLYIIFAVALPVSALGGLFSLLWLGSSIAEPTSALEVVTALAAVTISVTYIVTALAAVTISVTYIFTYIFSLKKRAQKRKSH